MPRFGTTLLNKRRRYSVLGCLCLVCCTPLGATPLTDPTRPPQIAVVSQVQQATTQGQFHLTSIRIRPGAKTAVLNGQTLSEGQRLGQAILRKIESNRVVLSHNGERRVLTLFPNTLNKTPSKVP